MDLVKLELAAELVVDGRVPSSPVLSPDGRWVAYVLAAVGQAGEHPSSQLWVAAVDSSVPPRQLDIPPAHLSSPRWAPDSESIFFLPPKCAVVHVRPGCDCWTCGPDRSAPRPCSAIDT
jgi:dipeptidyl aminopeptidase/acylaminoacyl peptidase